MANSKRFSFNFKSSSSASKARKHNNAVAVYSDDETLPDLVLDPIKRRNVASDGTSERSEFSGYFAVGETPRRSKDIQSPKCLGIKTSRKRPVPLQVCTNGRKKMRLQEPVKNSPEIIDITEDEPDSATPVVPEDRKDIIVIDLEQLDEITDTFEGEELSGLEKWSEAAVRDDVNTDVDVSTRVITPPVVVEVSEDELTFPEEEADMNKAVEIGRNFEEQDAEVTSTAEDDRQRNRINDEETEKDEEDKLDHRRKLLTQHRKPLLRMAQQLMDVARNQQYLMRDEQGKVSVENDNVAQHIIDMGLLLKITGKRLQNSGKDMQKQISDARAAEELQLKTELSDSEAPPAVTNRSSRKAAQVKKPFYSLQKLSAVKKKQKPAKNADAYLRRKYICQLCGFAYCNKSDLETHLNKHAEHQILCEICGKGFYDRQRQKVHVQFHSHGFLTCSICGVEKENKNDLKAHVNRHNRERFICTVQGCDKSYKDKGNWRLHVSTGHSNERTVPCQICGKFYKNANVARSHACRDHKYNR